jgi:Kef-type K+ transport system membrane component KefB
MPTLSHHDIVVLFLQISIMLALGKLFGELVKKAKQPAVIGEILAGILLGPTVLGTISPQSMAYLFPRTGGEPIALHGLTSMSVVLLLFVAGLEVEFRTVLNQGRKALATSWLGILLSFSIGFWLTYFFPDFFGVQKNPLIFSLFIGTALSITALPIIARTLMDLGLFKSNVGMLIIASAMMDDVLGWIFFSVILGMMNPIKEAGGYGLYITIFGTLAFAIIMLTLGRRGLNQILPWVNKQVSFPGGILSFSITLGFLGASFTEAIGIHAIFGAFIVGIALGDSIHMSKKTKEIIHDFVSNIFAPLFFVSIGLKVNFIANFNPYLVISVILMAFVGKTLGCTLGARISGFPMRESLAIGFGMNARGAMEIILASLAYQAGLIDQYMFVALVVMALVTSMTSGYFIRFFMPKGNTNITEPNGFIILGDNEITHLIAKYLTEKRIPVLVTDPDKKKIIPKYDFTVYQGDILDKKVLEQLDLSRYGYFLAMSENDVMNEKACKLFATELDEEHSLRLISKPEWQSASVSLPQNLLFRAIHWNFTSLERASKMENIKIIALDFESTEKMERFIVLHNKRQRIIPLFVRTSKQQFQPISSYPIQVKEGSSLVYIEIPEQPKIKK